MTGERKGNQGRHFPSRAAVSPVTRQSCCWEDWSGCGQDPALLPSAPALGGSCRGPRHHPGYTMCVRARQGAVPAGTGLMREPVSSPAARLFPLWVTPWPLALHGSQPHALAPLGQTPMSRSPATPGGLPGCWWTSEDSPARGLGPGCRWLCPHPVDQSVIEF